MKKLFLKLGPNENNQKIHDYYFIAITKNRLQFKKIKIIFVSAWIWSGTSKAECSPLLQPSLASQLPQSGGIVCDPSELGLTEGEEM